MLEIMRMDSIPVRDANADQYTGIIHFAVSTGDRDSVTSHPRETGDGCFESVILDPERNRVENT